MDDFDDQYAAAVKRGNVAFATQPRAVAVHYDAMQDRLVVELANGATFLFPPRLAQGLAGATDEQIAKVEIAGVGFGLHWEELDADHNVASLLAGRFGTNRYMIERFGPDWHEGEAA